MESQGAKSTATVSDVSEILATCIELWPNLITYLTQCFVHSFEIYSNNNANVLIAGL